MPLSPPVRRWKDDNRAILMLRTARDREFTRYGPTNFYEWTARAKRKYIHKRWPQVRSVCNGVPFSMNDSRSFVCGKPK